MKCLIMPFRLLLSLFLVVCLLSRPVVGFSALRSSRSSDYERMFPQPMSAASSSAPRPVRPSEWQPLNSTENNDEWSVLQMRSHQELLQAELDEQHRLLEDLQTRHEALLTEKTLLEHELSVLESDYVSTVDALADRIEVLQRAVAVKRVDAITEQVFAQEASPETPLSSLPSTENNARRIRNLELELTVWKRRVREAEAEQELIDHELLHLERRRHRLRSLWSDAWRLIKTRCRRRWQAWTGKGCKGCRGPCCVREDHNDEEDHCC